ncbi:MAG: tRNA (cytidine(56)-2'-O)-methyltransferase [Candidatus Altiarchaeota archaeon]|nr:tRNA (cytidine(56)-2'-O)-methyltransferase [Candidatus Altiarchaeota archaeon]
MRVEILRLGHRFARDKRISTHIGLVSRAFGADKLVMDVHDPHVEGSIQEVVSEWGGSFTVSPTIDWHEYIRNFDGDSIHLTMYGININKAPDAVLSGNRDQLVILGGKKVPSEVYQLADYNIALGNQPHSEVAALAVYLDRLYSGRELDNEFSGGKKIIPQEHGKRVEG